MISFFTHCRITAMKMVVVVVVLSGRRTVAAWSVPSNTFHRRRFSRSEPFRSKTDEFLSNESGEFVELDQRLWEGNREEVNDKSESISVHMKYPLTNPKEKSVMYSRRDSLVQASTCTMLFLAATTRSTDVSNESTITVDKDRCEVIAAPETLNLQGTISQATHSSIFDNKRSIAADHSIPAQALSSGTAVPTRRDTLQLVFVQNKDRTLAAEEPTDLSARSPHTERLTATVCPHCNGHRSMCRCG